MGSRSDDGPFYYRVQSPVVLIEFDHHPGIVFDNPVPAETTSTRFCEPRMAATTGWTCSASTTNGTITPTATIDRTRTRDRRAP